MRSGAVAAPQGKTSYAAFLRKVAQGSLSHGYRRLMLAA